MRNMKSAGFAALVIIFLAHLCPMNSRGQALPAGDDAKRFVGTWRLVSDVSTGVMIYDNLGNMAVQVMPLRERHKFAGAQPTPDEAKDAINGYLAYFGTYSVDASAHAVTHHRKGSLNPGQVGDDAVRRYEFEPGDRLVLLAVGSGNQIIWERAK
jgi:hypothetical protein